VAARSRSRLTRPHQVRETGGRRNVEIVDADEIWRLLIAAGVA
jgi:hypothetical protein